MMSFWRERERRTQVRLILNSLTMLWLLCYSGTALQRSMMHMSLRIRNTRLMNPMSGGTLRPSVKRPHRRDGYAKARGIVVV